ncbi:uncharacterized protein LOC116929087 isoform X4 [Daphnia magna]|uniref:uncharacterized protein LOC116929087 isoform X4 n=1 Tax=Daphnia magna TaxID=35525 RepID=UPI001E1BC08D|nr:uncharacterized protein LOC116929087 isoform X4 [Daphnia magna]
MSVSNENAGGNSRLDYTAQEEQLWPLFSLLLVQRIVRFVMDEHNTERRMPAFCCMLYIYHDDLFAPHWTRKPGKRRNCMGKECFYRTMVEANKEGNKSSIGKRTLGFRGRNETTRIVPRFSFNFYPPFT